MDYNKPSRAKSGEDFYKNLRLVKDSPIYNEESVEKKKLFLIVCEGENTEPCYFEKFPVPTKSVIIKGGCNSRSALVEHALSLKSDPKYAGREIWCIFDYDLHPEQADSQPKDFNNAILKAAANGMKVAWSNDAFELWFVLHYQKIDAHVTREELYTILKKHWNIKSFSRDSKTKKFCAEHYERHGGYNTESQNLAIRRAKELHKTYGTKKDFANHCPCTTVYLLVEELNRNRKK